MSNTNVPDKSDVDLDELMKTYAHSLQREMTVTDTVCWTSICIPDRGNQKLYQQSTNAHKKSIEIVFLIAICRQWGDKWQSKTLFLLIFYLHSSIVLAFSIAAYQM